MTYNDYVNALSDADKKKLYDNRKKLKEDKINHYKTECGCSLGAKTMTVAFAFFLWMSALQHGFFTAAFLKQIPFVLIMSFLGAVAGKLTGIGYARFKLKRLQKTLQQ